MRRLVRNYILGKVVSFFLVGTCMGQAPKVVEFAHYVRGQWGWKCRVWRFYGTV
jgi:hypothetical protein